MGAWAKLSGSSSLRRCSCFLVVLVAAGGGCLVSKLALLGVAFGILLSESSCLSDFGSFLWLGLVLNIPSRPNSYKKNSLQIEF